MINFKDTYETIKNVGRDLKNLAIVPYKGSPRQLTRRKRKVPRTLSFRPEVKTLDLTPNAFYSKFEGTFLLLNGIAQGSGDQQRVGRKIKMMGISLKISYNGPSSYNSDSLRLVLLTARAPADTEPVVADIFKQTGNDLIIDSYRNGSYLEDYRFLRDRKIVNNPITSNIARNGATTLRAPLGMFVGYSGTGSTIASINQNALYLLVLGKYAAASGDGFKNYVTVTGQLTYLDH